MKSVLIAVGIGLALAGLAAGIALWVAADVRADHQRTCAALGARSVELNRLQHLCVTPDGRVVGP